MKQRLIEPPRVFNVGSHRTIAISHCADVELEADEQVTFVTQSGTEYDVVRKSWGYYATPSTNSRLEKHGLRAVLVANRRRQLFVMLCERGQEAAFELYLKEEDQVTLAWIDDDDSVNSLLDQLDCNSA